MTLVVKPIGLAYALVGVLRVLLSQLIQYSYLSFCSFAVLFQGPGNFNSDCVAQFQVSRFNYCARDPLAKRTNNSICNTY